MEFVEQCLVDVSAVRGIPRLQEKAEWGHGPPVAITTAAAAAPAPATTVSLAASAAAAAKAGWLAKKEARVALSQEAAAKAAWLSEQDVPWWELALSRKFEHGSSM